jgi:hypothetical protein
MAEKGVAKVYGIACKNREDRELSPHRRELHEHRSKGNTSTVEPVTRLSQVGPGCMRSAILNYCFHHLLRVLSVDLYPANDTREEV